MGEAFTSRVAIYDRDDLMRLDELDKKITQSDLEALETFADRIFGKVGIDVEFTRHFLDRVNDDRNGEQITGSELTRLFKQEYKKWGKPIAQMGPDAEAVMKDMRTDVNVPFTLQWDKNNQELDLVSKTVMRKQDFKSSNRDFAVEGVGIITKQNTTKDVKPGEIRRQANKLGLMLNKDELPNRLYRSWKNERDKSQ